MATAEVLAAPVLSELSLAKCRRLGQDRRWPKWSTQCFMRSLGLPVLNACLIAPADRDQLASVVNSFARRLGTESVMVRSDGGVEAVSYRRGGLTLPVPEAIAWAEPALADGRAVLLLEPTNRFTNASTAMIRIDRSIGKGPDGGQLTVELLGAGFDLADLARTGLQPHARVEVRNIDWDRPEPLWPHDVTVTVVTLSDDDRIERRLDFVGRHCLPADARSGTGTAAERARAWLWDQGYRDLFEPFDLASALRCLPDWHRDAFSIVAALPQEDWNCVATGWSDLGTGRQIYWDIVDGSHKYGRG
ncbi:hypothetical protein [Kribbella catacumbae]|uniref:hypothetical protein n=1 Tax=Kribbella catacumbae TaxID=460086 RepID=UPI000376A8CE|nr:hypothetical protein [Kribbella catacumbae]